MRFGRWACVLLLVPALLAGCKNFWVAPSSSSGGGTSTLSSGVFYVLNQATGQITAYSISSGTLTPVSGSPFPVQQGLWSMAISPNHAFLYVSSQGGIFVYSIGSSGALTLASSTAISGDTTAYALAVDATGQWLIDASALGEVYAIPISSSTGLNTSSTAQGVQVPGVEAQQVVLSPDNKFVFVTAGAFGSAVIPFTATNTDPFGAPIDIGVKGSGGSAISVAVDPIQGAVTAPRLFYIGESAVSSGSSNTGGVRVFNYSALLATTPTVTEVTSSPFASGGLAPYSILPKSTGDYVYVANRTVSSSSTGNIVGFQVTGSTGAYTLTALSSSLNVSAGTYPVSLAEDSLGNYLLLANFGSGTSSGGNPDLEGFNFDSTTAGKLDSVLSSSTGTDPVGAVQVLAIP